MILSVDEFVKLFSSCPICNKQLEFDGTDYIKCNNCHSFYAVIDFTNIKQIESISLFTQDLNITLLLPDQVLHIETDNYDDIIPCQFSQALKLFKNPVNIYKFLLLQT